MSNPSFSQGLTNHTEWELVILPSLWAFWFCPWHSNFQSAVYSKRPAQEYLSGTESARLKIRWKIVLMCVRVRDLSLDSLQLLQTIKWYSVGLSWTAVQVITATPWENKLILYYGVASPFCNAEYTIERHARFFHDIKLLQWYNNSITRIGTEIHTLQARIKPRCLELKSLIELHIYNQKNKYSLITDFVQARPQT